MVSRQFLPASNNPFPNPTHFPEGIIRVELSRLLVEIDWWEVAQGGFCGGELSIAKLSGLALYINVSNVEVLLVIVNAFLWKQFENQQVDSHTQHW